MTEPQYAHDCSNDHHGRECGRTPCGCPCHGGPAEVLNEAIGLGAAGMNTAEVLDRIKALGWVLVPAAAINAQATPSAPRHPAPPVTDTEAGRDA